MRALVLPLFVCSLLLAAASDLRAEDVLKPTKAMSAHLKALRRLSEPQKSQEDMRLAKEYLAKWDASNGTPTSADKYALSQFRQAAGEYLKAATGYRGVQADAGAKEKTRDYAASAEASLLTLPKARAALGAKKVDEMIDHLCKYADAMAGPARKKGRSTLKYRLAMAYDLAGKQPEAHAMRMAILADDSSYVSKLARPLIQGLLGSTYTMAGYDAMRAEGKKVMDTLRKVQGMAIADAEKSLARAQKTGGKGAKRAEAKLEGEKKKLAELDEYEKPFALLGKPAPEWTLKKAFGDVSKISDLKGKVVVMDFWATWCDTCNFPIDRDLVKAYGSKGLAILGVTATGSVCYPKRFDADEDFKDKADGRLVYAARLAGEDESPDGESILAGAAYKEVENETITAFIANHELSWPTVKIDKDELASKYAHQGWPHTVVLDKQGRVRFFRTGRLSRSNEQGVAAFKKMIETLLAE